MKYLLLFALLGVIWWVWKKRSEQFPPDSSAPRDPAPEKMVTCAHCGVHLPESDALLDGGRAYCNVAHRDAGPADKT
ncbi:MAG TPA: PP0621 family protein [Azonexus sp.]|nr:PP0621 family protein [Azonexus sp.]